MLVSINVIQEYVPYKCNIVILKLLKVYVLFSTNAIVYCTACYDIFPNVI